MPPRRCHGVLILAILCNCVVLFYLVHTQNDIERAERITVENRDAPRDNFNNPAINYASQNPVVSAFEGEVTIIIIEFEMFENDLSETVQSILKIFPLIRIVVVSQQRPYPPLDLPNDNVQLVLQEVSVDQRQSTGRPENYINTPYIMVVPDGTRFITRDLPNIILKTLKELEKSSIKIVAVPLDSREETQCNSLKVDLKRWTMEFSVSLNETKAFKICNSVSPDPVVILKSAFLHSLSVPYFRPFLQGLFIQASVHHILTKLLHKNSFSKGTELFTNPHNRWKRDRNYKRRLLEMYRRFGIKRITSSTHTEWFGCNKDTARCFGTVVDDIPEYIYSSKWTPPCCLRNLRETARYVFQLLDKSNVKYWLEGGSLLGAARMKDIILWDYDVDIGILRDDIKKSEFLQKADDLSRTGSKFVDASGFVWEKAREGDFFRVQYSQFNHLHVDIFPFYERNGVMTKNTWFKTHRQDTEFPAHFLKPLTRVEFIGIKASAPNNIKEFLEYKFGKGVIENPQYPNAEKLKKKHGSNQHYKIAKITS